MLKSSWGGTTGDGTGEALVIPGVRLSDHPVYEKTSVSGPRRAVTLASFSDHAVHGALLCEPRVQGQPREVETAFVGSRTRIQQALAECKDAIEVALEYASDPIAKLNALTEFARKLTVLWDERAHRERPFAILVNRLQTMMLDMDMESVSAEKIQAVRSIIFAAAASSQLTNSDIRSVNATLAKVGCDVFTGFRASR